MPKGRRARGAGNTGPVPPLCLGFVLMLAALRASYIEQNPDLQLGTNGKVSDLGFFFLHTTEGVIWSQITVFLQPWEHGG